jgi:hypothetical protein
MAVLALGRLMQNSSWWCQRDPTLAEILSDSIVQAVMEADRIDPQVLEAQLQSMARKISQREGARVRAPGATCSEHTASS